jgi:hypothetical protein
VLLCGSSRALSSLGSGSIEVEHPRVLRLLNTEPQDAAFRKSFR